MLYDNRFTGWISTITTGGTARFTVPAAGQPGRHVIEVVLSDFTFPHRNMQQSPAPNRPQFKIGFTRLRRGEGRDANASPALSPAEYVLVAPHRPS
jgi:hypothetical protein